MEPLSTVSSQINPKVTQKYQDLKLVEAGLCTNIYRGTYAGSHKSYLIKTLHKRKPEDYSIFIREIQKLIDLRIHKSPYIVPIFEFDWDSETYEAYYAMPNLVCLSSIIMTNSVAWDPSVIQDQAMKVLLDISRALLVLHDKEQISHNNLNIYNVFYDAQADCYLLGNLYGSVHFHKAKDTQDPISLTAEKLKKLKYSVAIASLNFLAPELIEATESGEEKSEKLFYSDIFSLGCVVTELIGGINDSHRSLNEIKNEKEYANLQNEIYKVLRQRLTSEELAELINSLLNREPDKRPLPKEIIAEAELLQSTVPSESDFALVLQRKRSKKAIDYAEAPPQSDYTLLDEIPREYYPPQELQSLMESYFGSFRVMDLDSKSKELPILGPLKLKSDGAIYLCQFFQGKPHGRGERYAQDSYFVGNFSTGALGPSGIFIDYKKKRVYCGSLLNFQPSGHGEVISIDGFHFKGSFLEGKPVQGALTLSDVAFYEGHFLDEVIQGLGKVVYEDGSCYQGSFSKGVREGWGKMEYANGDVYDGHWAKGVFDGLGKLTIKGVGEYDGRWNNGMKHGHGKLIIHPIQYEGPWDNNRAQGKGIFSYFDFHSNETRVDTQFVNNAAHGGASITAYGNTMRFSCQFEFGKAKIIEEQFKRDTVNNESLKNFYQQVSHFVFLVPILRDPPVVKEPVHHYSFH